MSQKEMLTLFGDKVPCFNLTMPVGVGATNLPDDVMLIQVMVSFIAEGERSGEHLGITTRKELPGLTGAMDKTTLAIIHKYQMRWARILLNTDNRIHPANYASRDMNLGPATRRMTITLLHQHCQGAAALMDEADYTTAMVQMFPEVLSFGARLL